MVRRVLLATMVLAALGCVAPSEAQEDSGQTVLPADLQALFEFVESAYSAEKMTLETAKDADLETLCKELSQPDAEPKHFHDPKPSRRFLVACAAWKKGLTGHCIPVVSADEEYQKGFQKYRSSVLEDLAWIQFLRAVTLLTDADRREVLPHLRLVVRLSPEGSYAAQAKDLLAHVEKLVAEAAAKPAEDVDESTLTDAQRATLYVSQLKDLSCPQGGQPGFIMPYDTTARDGTHGTIVIDEEGEAHLQEAESLPTFKLRKLGMKAVPALIEALKDETPTRTVYAWRNVYPSRYVWRVSDFAWTILRDITRRQFGGRAVIGYTFGSMTPEQKRAVIGDIRQWYDANKDLSPDDRMFSLFSSTSPGDWLTAGEYFLKKNDRRAVQPLVKIIRRLPPYTLGDVTKFPQGNLCKLLAEFGDPNTKDTIKVVMDLASKPSTRLDAAIALSTLGDSSGIPVAVEYLRATRQPDQEDCEKAIWLLMRTQKKEGMEALKSIVQEGSVQTVRALLLGIEASATRYPGRGRQKWHEAAPCAEICPVLIAAMDRNEYTGVTMKDTKVRINDVAARVFAILRKGTQSYYSERAIFDIFESDEAKRDAQITALKEWYEQNRNRLIWDSTSSRLVVREEP
jgi:hypothetical protein